MLALKIGGKARKVDIANPLGQGGEACVYDLGDGTVLKLYRRADDPSYAQDPAAQAAATKRLDTHQRKLREFPRGLPSQVVAPLDLATDSTGRVVGYTMPFVRGAEVLARYGQPRTRQAVPHNDALTILRNLRSAVASVHAHQSGVVIGDFNSLNVMVTGTDVKLIDADSYQYGTWQCVTYTTTYVDPLLCVADAHGSPSLAKPHNVDSDNYALTIMVCETLLCVGPYGGTYAVKGGPKHNARPMHRITVWHPDARYPRPAEPWRGLVPDDLMAHFTAVFQHDARGTFPAALLDDMRWTTCSSCGLEHARPQCPKVGCGTAAPALRPIVQTTQVRGTVTATTVYQAGGRVVRADVCGGQLQWLTYEDDASGRYVREDGTVALRGAHDRGMRFRLTHKATYAGMGANVVQLDKTHGNTQVTRRYDVGTVDGVPAFAATASHAYWCEQDGLYRDDGVVLGDATSTRIGDILAGQTRFWCGDKMGVGFARAGGMTLAFVFDAERVGINDTVRAQVTGKLLDATCAISGTRAWFLTTTVEQNGARTRTVNRCRLIRADGTVEATAEAEHGDGTWLGNIRGATAAGSVLLVPTDDGVVCVAAANGSITATRTYPDTDRWVDVGCRLYAAADGLYVVSADDKRITRLVIK